MKKTILLSFLVLFIPVILYGQDKVEAPVWSAGDKWTYKDATGTTFTNEVLDVKEDVFVVKREEYQNPAAYDKKTMNVKFLLGSGGEKILDTGRLRKVFDFPLFVGKKWTDTVSITPRSSAKRVVSVTLDSAFKIENIVEVKTPAGTFKTYVIYLNQENTASRKNGWVRYWYSPEVKTWIKREFEKTDFWTQMRLYDAELISYELKK